MEITDVLIDVPKGKYGQEDSKSNLLACFSLIFDGEMMIHCVKLINGSKGPFISMPAEKKLDHCPKCKYKNSITANYCNYCGDQLEKDRHFKLPVNSNGRIVLYTDLVHPTTSDLRDYILGECLGAYEDEKANPGSVPPLHRRKVKVQEAC